MDELKKGVEKFSRDVYPWKRGLFEKLADGQAPHTLFITCSDSRIDPCLITATEPGDLFVVRNAGNLVPPAEGPATGEQGTIEYAVAALGVKYAIVCGHASCGAVQGLMNRDSLGSLPMVDSWLRYAEPVLDRIDAGSASLEEAVKANVMVQLGHMQTLPSVSKAIDAGTLELIGWYYDIRTGGIEQLGGRHGQLRRAGKERWAASVGSTPARGVRSGRP